MVFLDRAVKNKMMKNYVEITLIPNAEVSINFLWSKVFTQVHIAIVTQKNKNDSTQYGISFPEYKTIDLGSKLRIFGSEDDLKELDIKYNLRYLDDYVHITHIRELKESSIKGFATYSRFQPDDSRPRKARRYAIRHDVSYEDAYKLLRCNKPKERLPYIKMRSISSGEKFSFFIKKVTVDLKNDCNFGSYGLSKQSVVPEF